MTFLRAFGLGAGVLLLASTAACSGGDNSAGADSPRKAVEKFVLATVDEDYEAMCELSLTAKGEPHSGKEADACVDNARTETEKAKKALEGTDGAEVTDEQKKELKEFITQDPKVEEKDGVATVTYSMGEIPFTVTTKKVDGGWFVIRS